MADAAQAWRAFSRHFQMCRTCAQWDRDWAGWQQFCPMGRQLFLSERLTDEDRERLEFQARMSRFASSRDQFWKNAKATAKATAKWVAGICIIIGSLWVLNEILAHVHLRVDHDWWAYRVWKWYWRWWLITVPHTLATVLAFYTAKERDAPMRGQLLFTWNSAVAGFWVFLFGIVWTVERFGPWVGIPVFLSVFVLAGIAWTRLDARFGYWQSPR